MLYSAFYSGKEFEKEKETKEKMNIYHIYDMYCSNTYLKKRARESPNIRGVYTE